MSSPRPPRSLPSPTNASPAFSSSLYFQSLNSTSKDTILFIHGGFGTHAEWVEIARHLPQYHLLLPDLPGHGWRSSSQIRPITLATLVSHLASLITSHAHDKRAHLVGFSLGAYVALALAATHPDLVNRIFATGCGRAWEVGDVGMLSVATFLWASMHVPQSLLNRWHKSNGIKLTPEVEEENAKTTGHRQWAYARELARALQHFGSGRGTGGEKVSGRVRAPTLVVAGTTHDPIPYTITLAKELRENCAESRAVKLEGLPHSWGTVDPELFAKGVAAWIERRELPNRFEAIS